MATALTDIQVVEISPTSRPANRRRSLFQKSQNGDPMFNTAIEQIEKSDLPATLKTACKAALSSLSAVKADMPAGAWADLSKALKACMGGTEDPKAKEELMSAKKSADESAEQSKALLDQVEQAYTLASDGKFDDAKALLAKAAGKDPVSKSDVPAEFKAQWESMQKAQADAKAELEQMRKSAELAKVEATRKDFVAKSAAQYPLVHGGSELLGSMLAAAYGRSEQEGKALEQQFAATQEQLSKSDLFREVGSGQGSTAGSTAAKAAAAAQELMSKSAGMTPAQAFAKIYSDPKTYEAFEAERTNG
ncbi:MAG: hypothetical protein WCV82_03820 [Candidatus Paceibacterota bacterium]